MILKDDLLIQNIEKMIESLKQSSIQRTFPLTLIIEKINIKTAARVMRRLEQESYVSSQL